MARPRQRRKARSSSHRPISHSRHAKRNMKKVQPIRGPKALQEAWDKRKTIHQNYAKLGLALNLNPLANGGFERSTDTTKQEPSLAMDIVDDEPCIPNGFGRILRDETGDIIGFETGKAEECSSSEVKDVQLETDADQAMHRRWASSSGDAQGKHVLRELDDISASATGSTTLSVPLSGVGSRHMSSGEMKYLGRLVKQYGDDVHAMSRDRKLNPEQRTMGQLRRALRNVDKCLRNT